MLGIKQESMRKQEQDQWIGPAPELKGSLPGPVAKAWIERDHQVTSPSYTRDYPLVVKRALGSVVEDVDGNRFLDLTAGIAVCATGHCHPKVISAIEEQSRNLVHMCGSDFYYPSMVELSERLVKISPGGKGWRVFLTNSGTEAAEGAFKLARMHTKRQWVIAFHGAFHGRTMGALSLTASKTRQRAGFGPLVPMVAHAPFGNVDFIEKVLFKNYMEPTETAAIFVEAIQGEGGYVIPPAGFLKDLRRLCDRHGILLVCDEIQSGMGRTGKWFAFEHFDMVPDIILMAKGIASGMPLGAILAKSDVMDWPLASHASTFGGNPVACAAAVATFDLVESGYLAGAAKLGEVLHRKLIDLEKAHKCIANPRGLGLMRAVDVVNPGTGKGDAALRGKILAEVFRRGVIMLGCGEFSIRFCPALCINEMQLDLAIKLLSEAVQSVS